MSGYYYCLLYLLLSNIGPGAGASGGKEKPEFAASQVPRCCTLFTLHFKLQSWMMEYGTMSSRWRLDTLYAFVVVFQRKCK